jgi:hypothetical protein
LKPAAGILLSNNTEMETILQQSIQATYSKQERRPTLISRFFSWSDRQEKYRFGWVAGTIAFHGCVLTPITLFAIILSGNNIFFWALTLAGMAMSLVTNLAALPTKITIPVFFLSVFIDFVIIVSCIAAGFNIAYTYI